MVTQRRLFRQGEGILKKKDIFRIYAGDNPITQWCHHLVYEWQASERFQLSKFVTLVRFHRWRDQILWLNHYQGDPYMDCLDHYPLDTIWGTNVPTIVSFVKFIYCYFHKISLLQFIITITYVMKVTMFLAFWFSTDNYHWKGLVINE